MQAEQWEQWEQIKVLGRLTKNVCIISFEAIRIVCKLMVNI